MASKQSVTTPKSAKTAAVTPAAAAKPARATKPRAPRVSSAKHSKTVIQDTAKDAAVEATGVPVIAKSVVNKHEAISKIAYGYWIARGYQGGNAHEDWLRAEREFYAAQ
jgi:hypothetical protein